MKKMYDSTNPAGMPGGADLYAGYDDGRYNDVVGIVARFAKPVIRITVFPQDNEGDVLDCENGDATPSQCPAWVERRRQAGHEWPTVYCSESAWATVRSAFVSQGVAEPYYWIAGYPGSVGAGNLYPGSIAHQWIDHGSYDESVVADNWPPGSPQPPPAPPERQHAPDGNPYTMLAVDGSFGNESTRALQWTLNHTGAHPQLACDGNFGPISKRALQARLNAVAGPVAIDGDIGPQTVRSLQRHVGASQDGVWGAMTTRALQEKMNAGSF